MPFPLLMGFLWIFLLLMVGLVRNALEKEILKSKVVKAADFGFSRARTQSGVMTAETGTYHWMAPESQLPHSYMNRLRAAVGVVQKGLWPTISKKAHPKLAELLEGCFKSQIKVGDEREDRCKDKPCGSYF